MKPTQSLKVLVHRSPAFGNAKGESRTRLVELEEALKGSDKDDIDAKTKALTEASGSLAQKMYAEAQQAEGGEAGAGEQPKSGDDVVDAEFEEVDDDKKK